MSPQICPHGGHRQIPARESKSHILFKLFWDLFGISPAFNSHSVAFACDAVPIDAAKR